MLNFRIEKRLARRSGKIVVGMDEAGRGPIAGPIAVGAVLVDHRFFPQIKKRDKWWQKINDSKQLTAQERENLFKFIQKYLPFGVGLASARYIDRRGITQAREKAARMALQALAIKPAIILQDGNLKFLSIKKYSQRTIVQGDGRLWSIACASIVAKVTRDKHMQEQGKKFPQYNFARHKGYGTPQHLAMLKLHGPCRIHRFSFAPLKNWEFQKSSSRGKPGSVRSKANVGTLPS